MQLRIFVHIFKMFNEFVYYHFYNAARIFLEISLSSTCLTSNPAFKPFQPSCSNNSINSYNFNQIWWWICILNYSKLFDRSMMGLCRQFTFNSLPKWFVWSFVDCWLSTNPRFMYDIVVLMFLFCFPIYKMNAVYAVLLVLTCINETLESSGDSSLGIMHF